MKLNRIAAMALSALVLGAGASALADDEGFTGRAPQTETIVGDPQETYGTGSLTAYAITASNFNPRVSTTTWNTTAGVDRFITSAGGQLESGAMLPNGSQIERIELRACDSDAAAQVLLNFGPCPTAGTTCTLAGQVVTGVATVPGCNNFSFTLATPLVVNNQTTPFLIAVQTGTTANTTFTSVKLYYRLRISPAPATATFPLDVPTSHPFFRFIEALASAGITGGCGTGSYCPNNPVTRGEMAVFFATALGLHFPN